MQSSIKLAATLPSLPALPATKDLLSLYRIQATKYLSQNFLLDPRITSKIVKAAGKIKDGYVCEVGPGPGSITRSILEKEPRKLVVVEKDKRFMPILQMLADATDGKLDIILGDVLSHNLQGYFPEEAKKEWEDETPNIHIIGNLPFNVATPLIIRWLKAMLERQNAWVYGRVPLTLTFQEEVAQRMVAPINSKDRCRLSVMCQWIAHVEHRFTINGASFVPKPDVHVGVVKFVPRRQPLMANLPFTMVEKVVRNTFHYRQKYCRRGLENLFPTSVRSKRIKDLLALADVDGTLRPFQVSVEEFERLCQGYHRLCRIDPKLLNYDFRSTGGVDDAVYTSSES